jgi:cytochrome c
VCLFFVAAIGLATLVDSTCAQDQSRHERAAIVYRDKCARCHGENGQGVADGYQEPLRGEQTIGELAKLIEETMPEETPEDCVGEEARLVAEYVHQHFYARYAKPSPRLARLTVAQYQNAIADVIGRFAPTESVPSEPLDRRRFRESQSPSL